MTDFVKDHPFLVLVKHDCQTYLTELIWLGGQCGSSDLCPGCKTKAAYLHCEDCFDINMYCQNCTVAWHGQYPLHQLKEWTGSYFECHTLKDCGLRVQQGHCIGDKCCRPHPVAKDEFVILHSNGIHTVSVDFCGCETAETPSNQLLCMHFFPATSNKLHTAASFTLLKEFHLLSLESKVSAYKFYNVLSHHSDNSGLAPPKSCYEHLLRMARQWANLKLLKHSGCGHDPLGISNTQQGECAVLCPACPQPDDWKTVPQAKSNGWSYFVQNTPYKTFLDQHKHDTQEKSTCLSHNSMNMAKTKPNQGLDATGVRMGVCARHSFKLANGVRNLQVNMDYIFASAVQHINVNMLNILYNIACQWHKALLERLAKMPPSLQLNLADKDVTHFVPKFHLPAHITPCQWMFSFNWIKGVGHMDNEAPEQGWANINPIASSTKEMGPSTMLLKKIAEAIPEHNDHQEDFEELDSSLTAKYPTQLSQWKQDVEAWEVDASNPNPFEVLNNCTYQESIQLQLTKDKAKAASYENEPPLHPDVMASVLIGAGIDLEDQQYEPKVPKNYTLYLPSQINYKTTCSLTLETVEFQLRMGQAHDALNELCQALWSRPYMLNFKDCFLCGQGTNTCAQNCLKNVDTKVSATAAKYCTAYTTLCTLGPLLGKVGWSGKLCLLADDHIHAMTDGGKGGEG
ncbi:hypothetical protein PAXRUDRAFT_31186 [Paxillus rubicundulus Ve08.2h10]|uniref:CxC2-like cysteine cluster KDZ transposase-associated domain-containing protein n=1 Tax=Paxillus rubicundulus Ve08.2h10 TaxID=930991 RepID=A0A0D0EBY1_9AGAM|nr:hypothetical protein PAXRUDRAFT_31186 [Paxillus rubicundulus Ve08.2h10]